MGIWALAHDMATKTPPDRNRYVDFLRAISILFVILGHWLIATAWYVDGQLMPGHLLKTHPQYQWLTWILQVMPIFFMVRRVFQRGIPGECETKRAGLCRMACGATAPSGYSAAATDTDMGRRCRNHDVHRSAS